MEGGSELDDCTRKLEKGSLVNNRHDGHVGEPVRFHLRENNDAEWGRYESASLHQRAHILVFPESVVKNLLAHLKRHQILRLFLQVEKNEPCAATV